MEQSAHVASSSGLQEYCFLPAAVQRLEILPERAGYQ